MEESQVTTVEQYRNDMNNFSQETPFRKPRTEQWGKRKRKPDECELRIIESLEEGNQPNRRLLVFTVIPSLQNLKEEESLKFQRGVLQLILSTENQTAVPVSLFQCTTTHFKLPHMLGEIIHY
jgi:hypothetical protein